MTSGHADLGAQYTVRAVADRLGIATATLRSWNQRYRIGPAGHQPGTHRMYSETDIAVLRRMLRLLEAGATPASAARAARLVDRPGFDDVDSILTAAFRLDGDFVAAAIAERMDRLGVVETWDSLCRPLFAAVHERRTRLDQCIDVEHVLSRAVRFALQRVPAPARNGSRPVVLSCTDGEGHDLPLEALRAALGERGRTTSMLGAAVPFEAIHNAVTRGFAVDAVVLWSQRQQTADEEIPAQLRELVSRVVLAGPGWIQRERGGGVYWAATLQEALDLLDVGAAIQQQS